MSDIACGTNGEDGRKDALNKGTSGRELTAREVNRQYSADNKAEKRRERARSRGHGAGRLVLELAEKRHPRDPKKQAAFFMQHFDLKAGTGRPRALSDRRQTSYGESLFGAINELRAQRAAISNLSEFGRKHLIVLVRYWIQAGHCGATIENKISILRRFLCFWGKESVIPKGQELKEVLTQNGIKVEQWRKMVSVESLAWSDKGVDFDTVLKQVNAICPVTALQLEVQAAFGLRMSESLHLDPRGSDYGDMLRVVHGTKGGLSRDVPFDTDLALGEWQRDVLERAKFLATKNRKGLLTRDGYTLVQNKSHFYYVLKRVGITRKSLGVTAHGLRHEYAARFYTRVSGLPTPVSGAVAGVITSEIRLADLQARRTVSRALGHFRDDVTKVYVGSLPMMEKDRKKNVKYWIDKTEGNARFVQTVKDAGVADAWLGGRFAQGRKVEPDEKLRLILRMDNNKAFAAEQLGALMTTISSLIGRAVDLSIHLLAGEPDDALALMLR